MSIFIQEVSKLITDIPAGMITDKCFEARVIDDVTGSGARQMQVQYSVIDGDYKEGVDLELYDEEKSHWRKGIYRSTDDNGIVSVKCQGGIPGKSYEVRASIWDNKETTRHSISFTGNVTLEAKAVKFVPQGQDFLTINHIVKQTTLAVKLINTQFGGIGLKGILVRISISGAFTFQNENTSPIEKYTAEDGHLSFIVEPHRKDNIMMGTVIMSIPSSPVSQKFSLKLH